MKGLLLKDFYCIWGRLRTYLLICLFFIAGSVFDRENRFLLFFPCIMSGMLSMTLIAYDEADGWESFCLCLPCTPGQLVCVKYLVSLILSGGAIASSLIVHSVSMAFTQSVQLSALAESAGMMIPLTLLPTALLLPFIFKFGSKKGRIAYYLIIGVFCALVTMLNTGDVLTHLKELLTPALLIPTALGAYGFSWWLSIVFYRKRIQS